MGTKHSKIEGCYLPTTPNLRNINESLEMLDPRSPLDEPRARTPMNLLATYQANLTQPAACSSSNNNNGGGGGDRLGGLRKRILKGFAYTLNDPRSPNLNRTPLIINDANDKSLDLDDTFADLFVESKATAVVEEQQKHLMTAAAAVPMEAESTIAVELAENPGACDEATNNSSLEIVSLDYEQEETMQSPAVLQQTPPVILQQALDPRSPTIGVDRTPIIFTDDDDEASENAMLESILATLSLNLSPDTSVASSSLGTPNMLEIDEQLLKPTNKHLERVRAGGVGGIGGQRRLRQRRATRTQRQRIYQDVADDLENVTPKRKSATSDHAGVGIETRSPLSCMKNKPYMRSRSVELAAKSLKARLPLTSFDDILNPDQNAQVADLRIMQDDL